MEIFENPVLKKTQRFNLKQICFMHYMSAFKYLELEAVTNNFKRRG